MDDAQPVEREDQAGALFDMEFSADYGAMPALDAARAAGVRARLEQAARQLGPHDFHARIEMDGCAPVIVDGRGPADGRTEPDCVIKASPRAMAYILQGDMDPRHAMLYRRIAVEGSPEAATLLCDRLAGRRLGSRIAVDRAELPSPTTDIDRARTQFERFGYCIIQDALTPETVAQLRARLVEQAAAEQEAGLAWMDGDPGNARPPNQRVWALMNKGKAFVDLLDHPLVDQFLPDYLGLNFLLSNYQANIAAPGGKAMYLHTDQIGVQPPLPQVRFGVNFLWFLDDVTEANGGTRLLAGSHIGDVAPANIFRTDGTEFAAGPKGSVLIFDSRIWHGTGANVTDRKRHIILAYYVRSWLRTTENMILTVQPDVFATLSDRVKTQLGYRCVNNMGGVDGLVEGQVFDQSHGKVGEMKPGQRLTSQ
jgi:ectoine hydroxylase-related dioxygenase (phytanoyl-CoA dioxygenase family)